MNIKTNTEANTNTKADGTAGVRLR